MEFKIRVLAKDILPVFAGLVLFVSTLSISQAAFLCPNNKPGMPCSLAAAFETCDSADYREGVRAFLAKEKPVFKGR